jgi:hypothetical protein
MSALILAEPALNPSAGDGSASVAPAPSEISRRGLDSYVGSYAVDLDAVRSTVTPEPTATCQPIPHADLYDRVKMELEGAGIRMTEELHALYRGGDRYIGIGITDLRSPQDDAEVVVGWFNSHDHSHAATLLLGERVMVCFNLCLHAEIKVGRRHTKHIRRDLPGLVAHAVDRVRGQVDEHAHRMDRYRATPLAERGGHHVLIQLVEDGALPAGQLRSVLREWREPSHLEFAEAWNVNRLYQAVTGQGAPLQQMARRHRSLHRVMDGWCDERKSASVGPSRRPAQ